MTTIPPTPPAGPMRPAVPPISRPAGMIDPLEMPPPGTRMVPDGQGGARPAPTWRQRWYTLLRVFGIAQDRPVRDGFRMADMAVGSIAREQRAQVTGLQELARRQAEAEKYLREQLGPALDQALDAADRLGYYEKTYVPLINGRKAIDRKRAEIRAAAEIRAKQLAEAEQAAAEAAATASAATPELPVGPGDMIPEASQPAAGATDVVGSITPAPEGS